MTAVIPNSHQGSNRRSGRFSQRDESAVRDSAHMPSGRTFLANHAATGASALVSSFNSTGGFGPRFRIEVTTTLPVSRGRFSQTVRRPDIRESWHATNRTCGSDDQTHDPGRHGAALRAMPQPCPTCAVQPALDRL